jgi:hypothetical protein
MAKAQVLREEALAGRDPVAEAPAAETPAVARPVVVRALDRLAIRAAAIQATVAIRAMGGTVARAMEEVTAMAMVMVITAGARVLSAIQP